MRNLFLLLLIGCFTTWANAKVLTVSNSASSGGQYTSLQAAIDAAALDDTIYVHGSTDSYGSVSITKRLVIIGAGYAPQGTQLNLASTIISINIDSLTTTIPVNPVSNTKLIGLEVTNINCNDNNINGILIDRCMISGTIYVKGKNWILRNSLINTIYIYNYPNCLIVGNIINTLNNSNQSTVFISNNIFVTGSFYDISYAILSNNIFWSTTPLTGFTYCTFNNNVTYAGTAQVLPYGSNSGANNINANPQFVSTIPSSNVYTASMPNYDWHVGAASPCKNTGTDGSDIGIYGGSYPMANLTGAYKIPQITEMIIQEVLLPVNGTLTVKFKARKQD
jgi:hypothetical protein